MTAKEPDREQQHPISPALPTWKAFVIQLSQETTPKSGIFAGRVEHLASGRRERFASGKELLSAVMRLLRELEGNKQGDGEP